MALATTREFVFRRWSADYRPAKQSVLQPDPARIDPVDGSHFGRAASRIRRQDQRRDRRHDALGPGGNHPHGSVTTSYGSFGTSNVQADLAYGGAKWGNFISVGGLNSGRFLDPPEFVVMHDKGNEENLFDRVDYQFSSRIRCT